MEIAGCEPDLILITEVIPKAQSREGLGTRLGDDCRVSEGTIRKNKNIY